MGRSSGEEVATHPRILVWEIPQTEEPGGPQSGNHSQKKLSKHDSKHLKPGWLETTQTYCLTDLGTKQENQGVGRAMLPPWVLGQTLSVPLPTSDGADGPVTRGS